MHTRELSGTVRVRQAMGEMEKIQNFEFALLGEGLPPGHHFKPKTFCQNHFVCQKIRKNAFGNCTIMCFGKKNLLAITPRILGLGQWYWVIILSGLGELFGAFITLAVVSQDFEKNLSFR